MAEVAEAASPVGAVLEAEPPADFTQAVDDKKAAEEAHALKAQAEAEAAAAAEAQAEAERVEAEAKAQADMEVMKAAVKRELEAEIIAAKAPRPRVQVGDELPAIQVTSYTKVGKGGRLSTSLLSEAMGEGTTIIVGMPGAFTPTCTDRHLPGLLGAAARFSDLNVSKVAVLTTNDGFVNNGWASTVEACCGNNASGVTMLSDTRGELVEALGLAGDMGVGLEKRSKRFALVLEDRTIRYVAVDEGLDKLDTTSAAALLRYLDPNAPTETKGAPLLLGGLGLVLAAVVAVNTQTGPTGSLEMAGTLAPPAQSPAGRYADADAGDAGDAGELTEFDASVQRAEEMLARKRAARAAREARYAEEDFASAEAAAKKEAAATTAAKVEAEAAKAAAKEAKAAAAEEKAAARAAEAKAKAEAKAEAKALFLRAQEAAQAGSIVDGDAAGLVAQDAKAAKIAAADEAAAAKKAAAAERAAQKAEAKAAKEAELEAKAAAKAEAELAAAVARADREMDKAAAAKAKVKTTSANVAAAEEKAKEAAAAKKVAEASANEAKQEAAAYGGDESVAVVMQMLREAASSAK